MSADELLKFFDASVDKMRAILAAKNADYAGSSADALSNFYSVEALGICPAEVGFLTRMADKLCRMASFVKKGTLAVKEESATDTLLDLANYAILFAAFLSAKKGKVP